MNTEQKAKAYDKVLEKANALYKAAEPMSGCNVILETLFPELKESENERIRKWLIAQLKIKIGDNATLNNMIYKAIAWLEKQGEQKSINELTPQEAMDVAVAKCFKKSEQNLANEMKSAEESLGISSEEYNKIVDDCIYGKHTDKIKPKFKIGDFIVNDYCMGRIIEITNDAYLLDTEQGIPLSYEHNAHLWTIQDAKDGDVLACENGWTCIFKTLVNVETFS